MASNLRLTVSCPDRKGLISALSSFISLNDGNILSAIDGGEVRPFDYKPVGQLVEIGSDFAVNQVMNVKFSGLIASLFWRATYLYKLESPQSRARIAADWLLDLFFDPAVTQIRDRT